MLKKLKTFLLRFVVSVCSLALAVYMVRGEITQGFSHLTHLDMGPLAIALVLNFLSIGIVALRLSVILAIQRIHLPFWRNYYLWIISLFFNLFLPSAVGGDIVKAYYIYRDSGKKMASITSVLMDRFFGLMGTISLGFLAFLFAKEHIDDPRIGGLLFWLAGIVMVGVLLVLSRRFAKPAKALILALSPKPLKDRVHKLFDALELYRNRRGDFFLSYGYSLLAQGMFIVLIYFLARSISIDLPVSLFFLLIPMVTLVSMVPSVGGLGVREAAIVYLFRHYIPTDQAVALSLMCDLFIYGIGCLCGILYAIRGGASIRELEEMEP
ncbi:MAG TPA: lysylphosphatidylglycerol synthase transmembrane domain-containing protein [Candidatus Omnitrophota bacterium]|nr:lysylphosphatidylglycerol synthase transmembrane domain-containing protein [Candidatus Omnitrophota bacterium]